MKARILFFLLLVVGCLHAQVKPKQNPFNVDGTNIPTYSHEIIECETACYHAKDFQSGKVYFGSKPYPLEMKLDHLNNEILFKDGGGLSRIKIDQVTRVIFDNGAVYQKLPFSERDELVRSISTGSKFNVYELFSVLTISPNYNPIMDAGDKCAKYKLKSKKILYSTPSFYSVLPTSKKKFRSLINEMGVNVSKGTLKRVNIKKRDDLKVLFDKLNAQP